MDWLKYLRDAVGEDEEIEEIEVKVEYEDGTKKKWIFSRNADPVLEDNDEVDEEDEEDEEDED
ncbi:DNA primase [Brevibacillus sp. SAFN-007a]|uniref:DNA primase n=1 Tax=Brevibacillus sp. SAFN-007a TaxID=3436862 RepID=UPI003F7FB222